MFIIMHNPHFSTFEFPAVTDNGVQGQLAEQMSQFDPSAYGAIDSYVNYAAELAYMPQLPGITWKGLSIVSI